jgi:hypothetical protein
VADAPVWEMNEATLAKLAVLLGSHHHRVIQLQSVFGFVSGGRFSWICPGQT